MDSQIKPRINKKWAGMVLDYYADSLEKLGFRIQRRKRDHGFIARQPEYSAEVKARIKTPEKWAFEVLDNYADCLERIGLRVERRKRDHGFTAKPLDYKAIAKARKEAKLKSKEEKKK